MSDDTTTREAVERVRKHQYHRDGEGFQCAIWRDGPETCDCGSDDAFTALLEALDRVTRALDAATTAERDRIRNAVAGMHATEHAENCSSHHEIGDSRERYPCSCRMAEDGYNAALADVARIIDAEAP